MANAKKVYIGNYLFETTSQLDLQNLSSIEQDVGFSATGFMVCILDVGVQYYTTYNTMSSNGKMSYMSSNSGMGPTLISFYYNGKTSQTYYTLASQYSWYPYQLYPKTYYNNGVLTETAPSLKGGFTGFVATISGNKVKVSTSGTAIYQPFLSQALYKTQGGSLVWRVSYQFFAWQE